MWPKLQTWIIFALPFVWAFSNGAYGLHCNFCQSVSNYNSCLHGSGPVECTEALVNVTHLLLSAHNPSLGKVSPESKFQCFRANYTVNDVLFYQMGCSFAHSNICDGWRVLSMCDIVNGTEETNRGYPPTPSTPLPGIYSTSTLAATSVAPTQMPTKNAVVNPVGEMVSTSTVHPTSKQEVVVTGSSTKNSGVLPKEAPSGYSIFGHKILSSKARIVSSQFYVMLPIVLIQLWCQNL